MRSLSDILIKDLMDKGFKTFFGLQGGASARIIESVVKLGGKFHPVLNEQAAGYAAHGYFLTNNKEKDFKILRNYFKGSVGKIKELS